MTYELLTQNGSTIYYPSVEEGIQWETARKGTPGKLTFTVLADPKLTIQEGNPVRFKVDGEPVFYGFVFTKSQSKDGRISITAYDQLRYLKNKDTIVYEGKTASALLSMLAGDFNLQTGEIEDTGYVIESGVEENQTLFDMVQNALDQTLQATGKLYVLYDDFGKLTLKNIESMKVGILIDDTAAEDYDYSSSIDTDTYNKIKLTYDNEETGTREVFIAQNGQHQNDWGILQYFESLQSRTGAESKADALLSLYDHKSRKLSISGAFGSPKVRAGCSVPVMLDLGDMELKNYMVVEQCTHQFDKDSHTMDLTLIGGEFTA